MKRKDPREERVAQAGNDAHVLYDLGQVANCGTGVRRMVAPQTPS